MLRLLVFFLSSPPSPRTVGVALSCLLLLTLLLPTDDSVMACSCLQGPTPEQIEVDPRCDFCAGRCPLILQVDGVRLHTFSLQAVDEGPNIMFLQMIPFLLPSQILKHVPQADWQLQNLVYMVADKIYEGAHDSGIAAIKEAGTPGLLLGIEPVLSPGRNPLPSIPCTDSQVVLFLQPRWGMRPLWETAGGDLCPPAQQFGRAPDGVLPSYHVLEPTLPMPQSFLSPRRGWG